MSWSGKITGGLIGAMLGGPLGAIAGAALGHSLVDRKKEAELYTHTSNNRQFTRQEQTQAAYFITLFTLLGKIAKADGRVSKEEGDTFKKILNNMNLPGQSRRFAVKLFNEAKHSPQTVDELTSQFYTAVNGNYELMLSMLDMLFQIAAADNILHTGEETVLRQVKQILNINEQDYNTIKNRYFADTGKYYKTLNISPDASDEEIKKSYRSLVNKFHPDKIIAKGLPEEFIRFAEQRFQKIQDAYDKIRQERGF
ncbi:MAG TPA: co-chaperone DjlA [Spirochaetota bacterium]|nr:co-chaperone DjlA [Spirochaetota bacterium]